MGNRVMGSSEFLGMVSIGWRSGAESVWWVGAGRGGSDMFSMTEPGILSFFPLISDASRDRLEGWRCV